MLAQFTKGSFIIIFDLMLDDCAWDGHTSLSHNGNIHIEPKFDEALVEAVTIFLYLEFDAFIELEYNHALCNVPTFTWVFPSDLLRVHPLPGVVRYKVISTDIHTQPGAHWVAVHLDTKSSSDLFRLIRTPPALRSENTRTMQGFTTDVCGTCACVFAFCVDRGLSLR